MKKILILVVSIALLSSCTTLKIMSDKDKTVDFNKYKTYSFYGWKGDIDNLTKWQIEEIEKSFSNEFNKRGLTHKEIGGDVVLSFFIVVDQATTQNRYNGYYGYGTYTYSQPDWGWGSNVYFSVSGYAGPPSTGVPYKEQAYYQGTLVCDAFDNSTKKLAWQGVVSKALKPKAGKKTQEESKDNISKIVTRLMKKYPVSAK